LNLGRIARTVIHLKPTQLWFQVWRRVQRRLGPHPACASGELPEMTFLNLTARPKSWNDASLDMLWRYNLHYCDWLGAEVKKSGEGDQWKVDLVSRWIRENPRGSAPGWDPYPTSLRIVNWVKAIEAGTLGRKDFEASLAAQLDWLASHLEYHILANHYLANLKAMLIGNAVLGRDHARWMARYRAQLGEQVLSDGGHYERSVMYHAIILEDVLDVIRFCGDSAGWLRPVAERMLVFLVNMTGPDGKIALFNDAADGIAKSTAALCDYARSLGVPVPVPQAFADFPETGYSRLTAGGFVLFVDSAPVGPSYQPGHAHADTLTYELYCDGVKVVSDVGTSEYRGIRRSFERSTSAHNTVEVGGRDSSEVWSSHRVGSRAAIRRRIVSPRTVEAAHDGYGAEVSRTFRLDEGGLRITESHPGDAACVTRVHLTNAAEGLVRVRMPDAQPSDYERALEFGKVERCPVLSATFRKSYSYSIETKG